MTTTYAANFQGWWPTAVSEATPITCPSSQVFRTYGSYADCIATDASAVPTACESDTLFYNNQGTPTCGPSASCYTMTLAATSPLGTDLTTRYMCARSDWTYDTIYRNYATSTSSTALSSTAISDTGVLAAATSGPTSTTSTSEPTSSTSPTSSDNGGSSISGGAIAGIVIGCVAAIFLLAVFLLYRYRVWPFSKKQASISELPVSTQPQGIDEVHEIGSSGSAGKKSNTVYEIGTSGH